MPEDQKEEPRILWLQGPSAHGLRGPGLRRWGNWSPNSWPGWAGRSARAGSAQNTLNFYYPLTRFANFVGPMRPSPPCCPTTWRGSRRTGIPW